MVNSRGASVARGGLRSAPVRISNDSFFGVRPGEDVAQRVAGGVPSANGRSFRATSRSHCAILSCVTVKLGQTTSKSSSCGRKGISGPAVAQAAAADIENNST